LTSPLRPGYPEAKGASHQSGAPVARLEKGGLLKGIPFLKVFEVGVTRELYAEVQWRRAQLKAVDRRGFVVKLARGCIHISQWD